MIITQPITALSLGDTLREWNDRILDNLQRKTFGRVLTSAGWVGTAGAAADGELELFDDLSSIYKMPNIEANTTLNRDLIVGLEAYIASKHEFNIECIDAMSNTGFLSLSFLEQRPGESLVGKIMGAEHTLFEKIATFVADEGNGMEKTKILGDHKVDEEFDRFVSFSCLCGSTALGDSGLHFTVDGDFRGSLYNIGSITKALKHNSWLPTNIYIPKGATFNFECEDAFAAEARIGLKILRLTDSQMAAEVEASKPEVV